jgi:hypothetical protein
VRVPRRGLLFVAAVFGAAMTLLSPSAALAEYHGSETDYGVARGIPDDDKYRTCIIYLGSDSPGGVCFESGGDYFYVMDNLVDGYAAVAEWYTEGNMRAGSCVNKLGGHDTTAFCNKNFPEGDYIYFRLALYNSGDYVRAVSGWKRAII